MSRSEQSWRPLLVTVPVLVALGCAPSPADGPEEPAGLVGTEWTLASIDGRPPVAGSRVSLEIGEGTLGGYGGCNWYGGSWRAADGGLEVGPVQSTARACEAAGHMEQEARLHAALGRVRGYRVRGGVLELTDAAGEVVLTFERREAAAPAPEALTGQTWRLRQVRNAAGEAEAADTTMTVTFGQGTARGHAGCRDFTATYETRGDRIYFTSFQMATMECPLGEAALLREGRFTTDLGESTYYRIMDRELELTTAGGRRLILQAEGS